jgi:hypothetical protein
MGKLLNFSQTLADSFQCGGVCPMNEQKTAPSPRLPLEMNIEFRRSYARQPGSGLLKNISLTGAFIETNFAQELAPSDKILVTFIVSERKRKMTCTVIWKNSQGCGVVFHPFNKRDVQIVDDLMYFVESKRDCRRDVMDNIFKKVA